MDNFVESPFPTDLVFYKMKDYFKVEDRNGMLDHFYNDFNKRHFAGFTGVLAELTVKNNDRLAQWCIAEAGRKLAHHLIAIQKKIPEDMKLEAGGIKGTIIRRLSSILFIYLGNNRILCNNQVKIGLSSILRSTVLLLQYLDGLLSNFIPR